MAPLDEALYHYVMNCRKLHTDDTPVPVLAPGRKKTKTGRIWTYVRDDRNAGSSDPPAAWFAYSPDRQGKHPELHLRSFRGVLQADTFAGYDRLFSTSREGGVLTEAACWAHARRKSTTYISSQSATAEEALKRIGELYAIEAEIRGMPETERLAARQSRSAPLLASLHEWMVEKSATLSKKSRQGEAFTYALNQWDALCYYCRDGLAEPDNNAVERFAPSARERKLHLLRERSWWRTWCTAVRTDRNVPSERYRSGSVSAPHPERSAWSGLPTGLVNFCRGTWLYLPDQCQYGVRLTLTCPEMAGQDHFPTDWSKVSHTVDIPGRAAFRTRDILT